MNFGYLTTFQSLDKGIIERFGPTGFSFSTLALAFNFFNYNSGLIYHTTFLFFCFSVLFLASFIIGFFGFFSFFFAPFVLLFF
jgi:hypothetical protein